MQELHRNLNMQQYGWICLNRTWICLIMYEFMIIDKVLNMYRTTHIMRSLYKLMGTYWGLFGTQSKINNVELWKNNYSFLTIFAKYFILNFWEYSEYVLGFKYVKVLNISNFYKYDGSECASTCNYERVLNVPGFRLCQVSQ